MTITVTQEDIDRGFEADCLNCPVANALNRVTGRHWEVSPIPGSTGRYYAMDQGDEDTNDTAYLLPVEVSEFVLTFDDYKPVTPITFEFHWKG